MSQTKQMKEDMFIGASTNFTSVASYVEHVSLTSMANDSTSLFIPSGPYTHVRIHPLLAVYGSGSGIRVTGWSKLSGTNTYYPTLLFAGAIAGVQATSMITNNTVNLKGVHGITVTAGFGANTLINNSANLSVASIVVPSFGSSFLEVDFLVSTTGVANNCNILYSYCSIG
jgi:hypothetical protein